MITKLICWLFGHRIYWSKFEAHGGCEKDLYVHYCERCRMRSNSMDYEKQYRMAVDMISNLKTKVVHVEGEVRILKEENQRLQDEIDEVRDELAHELNGEGY